MKILVTGATGFLGRHLVRRLIADGHAVNALVRPQRTPQGLAQVETLRTRGVTLHPGALEDPSAVRTAVRGVEQVFHCAALVSDWAPWQQFEAANVLGVQHVIDACLKEGVRRLIHVSSTDVYGHPDWPCAESNPFRHRGYGYGDSKILGEERIWAARAQHGLPVTVLRPASIYAADSVPYVQEPLALLKQGLLFRFGGAPRPLGLTYIDNVLDALLILAEHPDALGEAFNVQDGDPATFNDFMDALADGLGLKRPWVTLSLGTVHRVGGLLEWMWGTLRLKSRPPLTRLAVELLGTHQGFRTDKLIALGWAPRIGLEEGIARVVQGVRAAETQVP